jgi:hypothetical protein
MKASNLEEVGQIRRRRGISMKTRIKAEQLRGRERGCPQNVVRKNLQEKDAEYDEEVEVKDVGNTQGESKDDA